MKKKKKSNCLESIRKGLDAFYKDVSFLCALNSFILLFLAFIFIKFFIVGIGADLIIGYFEIMVLLGLIFIMVTNIPIYLKGFSFILIIFLMCAGLFWIVFDIYSLMNVGFQLLVFFIVLKIVYEVIIVIEEIEKKKK